MLLPFSRHLNTIPEFPPEYALALARDTARDEPGFTGYLLLCSDSGCGYLFVQDGRPSGCAAVGLVPVPASQPGGGDPGGLAAGPATALVFAQDPDQHDLSVTLAASEPRHVLGPGSGLAERVSDLAGEGTWLVNLVYNDCASLALLTGGRLAASACFSVRDRAYLALPAAEQFFRLAVKVAGTGTAALYPAPFHTRRLPAPVQTHDPVAGTLEKYFYLYEEIRLAAAGIDPAGGAVRVMEAVRRHGRKYPPLYKLFNFDPDAPDWDAIARRRHKAVPDYRYHRFPLYLSELLREMLDELHRLGGEAAVYRIATRFEHLLHAAPDADTEPVRLVARRVAAVFGQLLKPGGGSGP